MIRYDDITAAIRDAAHGNRLDVAAGFEAFEAVQAECVKAGIDPDAVSAVALRYAQAVPAEFPPGVAVVSAFLCAFNAGVMCARADAEAAAERAARA